jgi:hypothetical protein
METQEFWSWPGLKRYFENTGKLSVYADQLTELEKLPVKDRKIIVQENGKDICLQVFIDEETLYVEPTPQPYPSWTWNADLKNWQPPVSRPASPKHSYDLLWNEDTQKWGLTGIDIDKIGEDGERYAVKRKYFNDWEKLQEYLYKINTVKYVHDQIAQQLLQPLKDRKIISPATDAAPGKTDYICLEMIE